jgi:hypothetical protein
MTARVPVRTDAVAHEVSDTSETVLFDEARSQLLVLNEVGASVWLLADGERSISDIVEFIVETLEADRTTVAADVNSFLTQLESQALIRFV